MEKDVGTGWSRKSFELFGPCEIKSEGDYTDLADAILTAIYDNGLPRDECGIIAR